MTDTQKYRVQIYLNNGSSVTHWCSHERVVNVLEAYESGKTVVFKWDADVESVAGTYANMYEDRENENLPHERYISPWTIVYIDVRPMTTTGK
jgi:hypothetical protein